MMSPIRLQKNSKDKIVVGKKLRDCEVLMGKTRSSYDDGSELVQSLLVASLNQGACTEAEYGGGHL